ncbi:T9SS type A sorting domain-containing protein [bacterium]|nr:T9SS type A sorting domain-containing protein [bacterium]
MLRKYLVFLTLGFLLLPGFTFAQNDWHAMMRSSSPNYFEIEKAFNEWWGNRPLTERGHKPVRRWLDMMRGYADPNGNIERNQLIGHLQGLVRNPWPSTRAANWNLVGPINPPARYGIGRIDCIAFHPTRPNVIFAGSPSGGLWKTVDYGQNWTPMYEDMPSLGVADIVIHPTNPDIMYVSTGDSDHFSGGPYIGILKTTDGGLTWNILLPPTSNNMQVDELIIHPNNPETLYAAGTRGIMRTDDGGANWTTLLGGDFEDIEFKPGNPNTLYVCGYGLPSYNRSTDGGLTWTSGAPGIVEPLTSQVGGNLGRNMLAVTPADSNVVYMLSAQGSGRDYDFKGLYKSTDGGNSFSTRSTQASAGLSFAQAWYDLAIAVSPTNPDQVFIGDSPFYRSDDGGVNWQNRINPSGSPVRLHVDIHEIEVHPFTGDLWVGCDGGIFLSANGNAGDSWDIRSDGLSVTQFYRLGTSVHENNTLLAGAQDNGTMSMEKGLWDRFSGGDGMECLVDWSNPNLLVASSQNGNIFKVTSGNESTFINNNRTGESGAWTTPFIQDPNYPKTFYAGFNSVWRTENAATWTNISGNLGGSMSRIIVPQIGNGYFIYAANPSAFYRSLDRGVSWSSHAFVNGQGSFYDMTANPRNPSSLYAAHQNGVYTSSDGGDSWTDITGNLPILPATAIAFQNGGPEALYVGTSAGIFYRDTTLNDWIPFMDGLPTVIINELEISYCAGKIRAATYGRGLWESDLYSNGYSLLANSFNVVDGTGNGDGSATVNVTGGFGPYAYVWDNGSGVPSLTGLNPGTYPVKITDKNQCVIRDTAIVGFGVGVEDQLSGVNDLIVYPNPTSDFLQVKIEATQNGQLDLGLYDMMGKSVYTESTRYVVGDNQLKLNLSDLSPGVYILDIRQENERVRTRVVKN